MTPVQSDKRLFTDSQGAPLDGGYVYVGQPSKAPQVPANQVTVTFKDDAGNEFTASQPLRTVGGKIVYNGSPIATFVDGEHSLLVLNSAGVQVEYSASISPVESTGGGGTASDTIQVGLTLADVKALDVAVGDVCRSVGRVTANDGLGADWLVISSTGSPGDDVSLIDFNNGLQGSLDSSKLYRREGIGTFILDDPITVLATADATSYRSTWTAISLAAASIPVTASSVIIRVSLYAVYPTGGISDSLNLRALARKSGSTSTSSALKVGEAYSQTNTNDTNPASFVSEFTVPFASDEFELNIIVNDPFGGSNNTTPDLDVSVIGYTINPE